MTGKANFSENPGSLSALISHAEVLKNRKEFVQAKEVIEKAIGLNPGDPFLIQRLALVTYKSRLPDPVNALINANLLLSALNPSESNDPETIGLAGSINKKMFEETGEESFIEESLWFYERGFSICKDYYNGINLAYLFLLKASITDNKSEARKFYEKSVFANEAVISICIKLIISPDFDERDDREYIYQTLAQAYLGMDQNHEVIKLIPTINEVSKGSFDLDTFHEQNSKLIDALVKFKKKFPGLA